MCLLGWLQVHQPRAFSPDSWGLYPHDIMLACECSVRSLDFSPATVFSLLLSFSLPAPSPPIMSRRGTVWKAGRGREDLAKILPPNVLPTFWVLASDFGRWPEACRLWPRPPLSPLLAPSPHWSLITPSTLLFPLSGTLVPADTLVPAVWAVLTLLILLVLLVCPREPPSLGSLVLLLFR